MKPQTMDALKQIVEFAEREMNASTLWLTRTSVAILLKKKTDAAHIAVKAILVPNLVVRYTQVGNSHIVRITIGRLTKYNPYASNH